jgi:FkbM family methyltransferase
MKSPVIILRALFHECVSAWNLADGLASKLMLGGDYLWLRFYRLLKLARTNARRRVRLKGGVILNYRFNEGDLQSIREVWLDGCYRLPSHVKPRTLVDLGGNIGLTSLWFAKKYPIKHLVVVEPDPVNASLIRDNFRDNQIASTVIEAAVGPKDGIAIFAAHERSNVGHVVAVDPEAVKPDMGVSIPMVSMATVLKSLPGGAMVDLMKMDIEGGETALMAGDLGWLERIAFIITELHPPIVNCEEIVAAVVSQGMIHHAPGSLFPESMDMFERRL